MFGTEAAAADNTSYNSSPSHNFLTSVDDTLRADNLSPSSSQGSPARSVDHITDLQPPSPTLNNKQLTELQPLSKPTSEVSTREIAIASRIYSSFPSIKSDPSNPTYYNSLITPVSQAPESFSGLYTPTVTSSTYYSTVTTPAEANSTYCHGLSSPSPSYYNTQTMPASASPSYYSSLGGMTTPTSASPSYYSSLGGMSTPTSARSSYFTSLGGMTTPYTDYSQHTSVNHPTLTPPFSTASPHMRKNAISPPQHSIGTSTSTFDNEGISPLSQHRMISDSIPLSAYRPNGESHVSAHIQHSAPTKYDIEYHQNNTSTRAGTYITFSYQFFFFFCLTFI